MSLRESYRIFFQNIWMIVQEVDVKNTREYSIISILKSLKLAFLQDHSNVNLGHFKAKKITFT